MHVSCRVTRCDNNECYARGVTTRAVGHLRSCGLCLVPSDPVRVLARCCFVKDTTPHTWLSEIADFKAEVGLVGYSKHSRNTEVNGKMHINAQC